MNTASAVVAAPTHRPSQLHALLWKEWRQQRWVFLLLLVVAYVLAISGLFVGEEETLLTLLALRTALIGLASIVGAVGILVLSANAFCGERDENSEQFLEMIPCSRSRIFWVKFGFVIFLVLLGLAPVGVCALFFRGMRSMHLADGALPIASGVVALASVPALISFFGGSVIGTILVSIPVAGACLAWIVLSCSWIDRLVPTRVEWSFWLYALFAATLLLAARRLWAKPERTWRRCAPTLAVTAVLLIAYPVVPMAAAFFYVTYRAPLSYFVSGNDYNSRTRSRVSGRASSVSPTGEYVVVQANYMGWGPLGGRSALVDVESGKSQWLTRFRPSFFWPIRRLWTPSGERFVLEKIDGVLWPLGSFFIPRHGEVKRTYLVVDARTGEQRSFDELCPGMPKMSPRIIPLVGWYSEHVFAFTDGRDILFADVEKHTVDRCKMPAIHRIVRVLETSRMLITARGVLAVSNEPQQGGLTVLCFTPDLPVAESMAIQGLPAAMPDQIGASSDGEWLLVRFGRSPNAEDRYIARLENGAAGAMLVSENPEKKGLISPFWHVTGFLPNSHEILLYGQAKADRRPKLGLFDADSRALREMPITALKGRDDRRIDSVELSPSGEYALVRLARPFVSTVDHVPMYLVGDLADKGSWTNLNLRLNYWPTRIGWLGDKHLLLGEGGQIVANRDGTGTRPLLREQN